VADGVTSHSSRNLKADSNGIETLTHTLAHLGVMFQCVCGSTRSKVVLGGKSVCLLAANESSGHAL
jgi:hypothetical protein